MTGADKEDMSLGTDLKTGRERLFKMLSFKFPSCTACNDQFGKVEAQVKPLFERLSNDERLNGSELELLLDWFDKLRIGAWLANKYMNKKVIELEPKYYINSRVGLKDRYLSITNTYNYEQKFFCSGIHTLAFLMSPTALTLRVNNLVFVNCSSDFVVSKQLGFPYPLNEIPTPDKETTDSLFTHALKTTGSKIFKTRTYSPKIEIAQVIYQIPKVDFKRILR